MIAAFIGLAYELPWFAVPLADLKNQSQGLVAGVSSAVPSRTSTDLKKQTDHDRRGRSPARMKMAARRAPESGHEQAA
jgi:hypothetical protein